MVLKKNSPGCPCCSSCTLMPTSTTFPDQGFDSLAYIQGEWSLRGGDWTDVKGASGRLTLPAGKAILADAKPNMPPYGVQFSTYFRGLSDTTVLQLLAGADADVSVAAQITTGAACGQLEFHEESISSSSNIGDIHWIRELRSKLWHKAEVCYDPTRGYVTCSITTRPRVPVQNEVQRLTLSGEISGGDYTLTFGENLTTAAIAWTADNTAMATAVDSALDTILGGDYAAVTFESQTLTQTLTLAGTTGATTLSYGGLDAGAIDAPYDTVTATRVQNALAGIGTLTGIVSVTGPDGGPFLITWTPSTVSTFSAAVTGDSTATWSAVSYVVNYLIEFKDKLAHVDWPQMTATSSLTGTGAAISMYTVYDGQGSDIQTIELSGAMDSVKIGYNGTYATSALNAPYDSLTAAAMQTYLETIPALSGNIWVTGATGGPWRITFLGSLANTDTVPFTATCSGQLTMTEPCRLSDAETCPAPAPVLKDGQTVWSTALNGGSVIATAIQTDPPIPDETVTSGTTATLTGPVQSETWRYSSKIVSTGQPGYGLSAVTGDVEFYRFSATAMEAMLGRKKGPCGSVTVTGLPEPRWSVSVETTTPGWDGNSAVTSQWWEPDPPTYPYWLHWTGTDANGNPIGGSIYIIDDTVTAASIEAAFALAGLSVTAYQSGGGWLVTSLTPDEVQTITIVNRNTPDAGDWTLTFGAETTGYLGVMATASDVQTALESLSGIGAGNATVSGPAGGPYTVTFTGSLAQTDVPELTATVYHSSVQKITINGNPDSGTWSLTFDGQTTTDLGPKPTGAEVQAALEALSNIGTGNVTVSSTLEVEFVGTLANTNVPEMTATYSFDGCDCPSTYGYDYDPLCIKVCATCDPSCDLAGSQFNAYRSHCDWDGVGYSFGDRIAVGTGALIHKTEITSTPYVASATLLRQTAGTYTLNVDDVPVAIVVTEAVGPPNTLTGELLIDGVSKGSFSLGSGPVSCHKLTWEICRHSGSVTVKIKTTASPFALIDTEATTTTASAPMSIGVDSSAVNTAWGEVYARRYRTFWDECPSCVQCGDCSPGHRLPDVLLADLTQVSLGAVACSWCPNVSAVWPLTWTKTHPWAGTIYSKCTWLAVRKNVCTTAFASQSIWFWCAFNLSYYPLDGVWRWGLSVVLQNTPGGGGWNFGAYYLSGPVDTAHCDTLPITLDLDSSFDEHGLGTSLCSEVSWPPTITVY